MTTENLPTIDEDIQVATEAFLNGRPIPPDVNARIAGRAEEARERIFREQGELDIAVPYLRESRET